MATVIKTTTRLDEAEADFADRLKNPDTDEAAALRADHEAKDDLSQAPSATVVHALIEAGITVVKEKRRRGGHARLADFLKTDPGTRRGSTPGASAL